MRSERVSLRAMRAVMTMAMMPSTHTAMRQPNGVPPKKYWPTAMVHLPSGGCTTNAASGLKMSSTRQLPSLASNVSFAPSTIARS